MAILNPMIVMSPPINTYFVDKDNAAALSGGIVYFYKDTDRTVLKPIYQQSQLPNNNYVYNQLANPVQLGSSGTPVDQNGNDINIWLFPFDGTPTSTNNEIEYYYVEVYSAGGILQETRSAWPGPIAVAAATDNLQPTDNLLTNPQFSEVNFNPNATYTFAAPISASSKNIAPGWDIVTNGAGNVSVTRIASTLTNVPSNPPYILNILTSAFAADIQLRQRLYYSPRLFLGNNVAGYFVAASTGSSATLTMSLAYSNGLPLTFNIATLVTPNGGAYVDTSGVVSTAAISQTTPNSDSPNTGYVDLIINIPRNTEVQISSIQICVVPLVTQEVLFLPQPVSRETDHTFNYFQPKINFKPIPSLLTGWDFPLNPAQITVPSSISSTPAYVLDQTIMATTAGTANISIDANSKALVCTTVSPNQAFYMMQYLSGAQAIETTLSNLSVNLSAMSLANPGVTARVYLYYSSAGGTIPLLSNPPASATIGTVDASGIFTLGAGGANWTEIPTLTGQARSGTLTLGTINDLSFNGFNGSANYRVTANNNFAIVVTFLVPATGTQVIINSCSVVPGDIPTRPAPKTADEVLRECQYYYETTLNNAENVAPQTTIVDFPVGQTRGEFFTSPFYFSFNTAKRSNTPNVILYSGATPNNVTFYINQNNAITTSLQAITNWTTRVVSAKTAKFSGTSALILIGPITPTAQPKSCWIEYNYTADARLGVV